jgi:hypothetical protein
MADEVERRIRRRYPIEHQVSYRVPARRPGLLGNGITLNMSSRGVLFTTDRPLSAGSPLTLEVKWPVMLDNIRALKLVTKGKVVWCDGWRAALAFNEWEFRLRRTGKA